jgi:hypothetical protein
MNFYSMSYQQTFRVTDQTVYKNGSWANIVKGAVVRITDRSDVVDTVEFGERENPGGHAAFLACP